MFRILGSHTERPVIPEPLGDPWRGWLYEYTYRESPSDFEERVRECVRASGRDRADGSSDGDAATVVGVLALHRCGHRPRLH